MIKNNYKARLSEQLGHINKHRYRSGPTTKINKKKMRASQDDSTNSSPII